MTGNQVRNHYLEFFKASPRDHAVIPPAPLVLQGDPTTLFTSSGMQPLVPFLKGEPHPMGTRLADSQPSFRAEDIEEVGDNRHTTFFEMLGNWSLGDYFKKEQLVWFFDFLIKEIELDPTRLYVTLFKGDKYAPRDTESEQIWRDQFNQISKPFIDIGINEVTVNRDPELGIEKSDRIFYYSAKKNWWSRAGVPENMPVGEIGGPDSEVFFDFDPQGNKKIHDNSEFKDKPCHPNCDCGRFLEIGNSVFMQYIKQEDGFFKELPKQNVDFGGGLERITAASNDDPDVFNTDFFKSVIERIEQLTNKKYESEYKAEFRVIADHLRAAVFMTAENIKPSNKLQGYILRRLLRRALVKLSNLSSMKIKDFLNEEVIKISSLAEIVINQYHEAYPHMKDQQNIIFEYLNFEQERFKSNMNSGYKAVMKVVESSTNNISGEDAFDLFQTHGILPEVLKEVAIRFGKQVDWKDFYKKVEKHQELSRTSAKGMFKGGLADHSQTITQYHTATHLLHQALRQVLGDHVQQMGSNITNERLRFDFKHADKLTDDQKSEVINIVNQKIAENLPVHKTIESKDQALSSGALAFFRETYPDKVNVYTIGVDPDKNWFSKELCGGPHVSSTGEIGPVTIKKEESVGAGVRRIYMVKTGH